MADEPITPEDVENSIDTDEVTAASAEASAAKAKLDTAQAEQDAKYQAIKSAREAFEKAKSDVFTKLYQNAATSKIDPKGFNELMRNVEGEFNKIDMTNADAMNKAIYNIRTDPRFKDGAGIARTLYNATTGIFGKMRGGIQDFFRGDQTARRYTEMRASVGDAARGMSGDPGETQQLTQSQIDSLRKSGQDLLDAWEKENPTDKEKLDAAGIDWKKWLIFLAIGGLAFWGIGTILGEEYSGCYMNVTNQPSVKLGNCVYDGNNTNDPTTDAKSQYNCACSGDVGDKIDMSTTENQTKYCSSTSPNTQFAPYCQASSHCGSPAIYSCSADPTVANGVSYQWQQFGVLDGWLEAVKSIAKDVFGGLGGIWGWVKRILEIIGVIIAIFILFKVGMVLYGMFKSSPKPEIEYVEPPAVSR